MPDSGLPSPEARDGEVPDIAGTTDTTRPRPTGRSGWGTLGVVGVLVLAGVLFTANARIAGGVDGRQPQDFAQLVQAESDREGELQVQVDQLQGEVDRLTDAGTGQMPGQDTEQRELTAFAAGRVGATGPGLVVRLWDAPGNVPRPDWVTNDYLVVHQQDLQAVINSLWAGGAEAMTLQDQRVISTSAFRCVGNVLRLHGQIYSPPYEVRAIGDPDALLDALHASPEILEYLDYVDAIGLGWSVEKKTDLDLAAFAGNAELRYAAVPEGQNPWVLALGHSGVPELGVAGERR